MHLSTHTHHVYMMCMFGDYAVTEQVLVSNWVTDPRRIMIIRTVARPYRAVWGPGKGSLGVSIHFQ